MNKNDKILIVGGTGLLGTPLTNKLKEIGYPNVFSVGSEYDARNPESINSLFVKYNPDIVFNLFVVFGGIIKNAEKPYSIFYDNLTGNVNIIDACVRFKVKKLIQASSQCIYGDNANTPFKEDRVWYEGPPTKNNAPYGQSKRILEVMLEAANEEYGLDYTILIPSNMYGYLGENFHPEHSHVIPSLIRRFVKAKENNEKEVIVWGDGTSTRQFLYNKDAANAFILAAQFETYDRVMNIGGQEEVTITVLANLISELVGYRGKILYNNNTELNGQRNRYSDPTRAWNELNWVPKTSLKDGLKETIEYFKTNQGNLREKRYY